MGNEVLTPEDESHDPQQLELFERSLELEQKRLEVQGQRNDVLSQAIQAADDAHKRHHEFQMERLTKESDLKSQRFYFVKRAISFSGVFFILVSWH